MPDLVSSVERLIARLTGCNRRAGAQDLGEAPPAEEAGDERSLADWFRQDHRDCDTRWAETEALLQEGTGEAEAAWRRFEAALLRHLEIEERILFPAVESATGMQAGGPTAVMRSEHTQMRGVLEHMRQAMAQSDFAHALEQGDSLFLLLQQHNVKEEGVLYPMAERALGPEWATLRARIAAEHPPDHTLP